MNGQNANVPNVSNDSNDSNASRMTRLVVTRLAPVVLCAGALAASFNSQTLAQGTPFGSQTLAQGKQVAATPGVPAFEVASIKPNVSGAEGTASYVQPGGRYTAINVTLRMLMKTAYQIHDTQIVDGPGWIDVDRFERLERTGLPTCGRGCRRTKGAYSA